MVSIANDPRLIILCCLSRLVSQLSYQSTSQYLSRARSIITRLRNDNQLHRPDANSLGLLASSSAKSGHTHYASSLIKSMLRSDYLSHVKTWSTVVSRLSTESSSDSINLCDSVIQRVRRIADLVIVANSKPDMATYNVVLNVCANLGDKSKVSKLFDEMPEWGCEPDVLTYTVMIKPCAKVDRKDLLVFVLERIIEKLLPNSIEPSSEPPLLPKVYAPNSKIFTTSMEGYMKVGRVTDTLRTLEAMRHQDDKARHPNHVTYMTVFSAFVKAGLMDKAREVLDEMTRSRVPTNQIAYNIAKELLREDGSMRMNHPLPKQTNKNQTENADSKKKCEKRKLEI